MLSMWKPAGLNSPLPTWAAPRYLPLLLPDRSSKNKPGVAKRDWKETLIFDQSPSNDSTQHHAGPANLFAIGELWGNAVGSERVASCFCVRLHFFAFKF